MKVLKTGGRPANTLIEQFIAKNGGNIGEILDNTVLDERKLSNLLTLIKMKEYLLTQGY